MAGYTRQSSFADGDTITAALFNDEYNQLVNTFNNSTGHKHDGTAAEGPVIGLIGDAGETSPNNKVLIDTVNNYIEFYIEVSSAPVQQLYIADGAIVPVTDNDIDLGTSSLEFKNLYLDGIAKIDTLTVDEAATVGTTLGVTGATTLSSTLAVTGATTLSSTLAVTGATTLSSTLAVTGTSTLTGNVTATNNLSVGGNLTVTGNAVISGNLTFGDADTDTITIGADVASNITPDVDDTYDLGTSSKEWRNLYIDGTANIDSLVADTADINAGTIDNTAIGGTTASSGAFTTLTASGATTLNGDVTLGDAATDNVVFNADVNSSIIPNTDDTYDLGSVTQEWRNLYVDGTANVDTLVIGTSTGVTSVDTDLTSVSVSDDTLASAKAIKTYVDAQVTAQDLDFQGDTGGALSIDLDSETLTIAGGTGIDTVGASNTLTVSIDSTVATLTGTQTLTNKTLTTPVIGSIVNTGTLTLPTSTDTLVGRATTDTLTNKTLTSPTLTSPVINTSVSGTAVLDDDTFATATATTLATSESIKAYVDARILTEDTLAEMNDVNITTPADGSLLFYDTTTSMWIDNVVSGDITIADTGVAAISSGVIVNDDINASAAISVSKTALVDGTGLTLTGDTLSVDASQTQITAVGTLTTGTWNATSIADAYIDNNLTISGGTVDNSVIGGTIAAAGTFTTLTATTSITGTLATAAQPNITSVGSLTSLTVSGDLTVDTSTLVVDSTNNRVGILDATPAVTLDIGTATDAIFVPSGTTAQRPGTPSNGYLRYNTDDAQFEGYADGAWGAIAGSGSGSAMEQQILSGDGSTTGFTLTSAPTSENNLLVFVDGVFQAQDTYSVSGTTLTFSTAPANGRVITVYHILSNISGSNMIVDSMTGDGSDVTLTLSVAPVSANNVQVYIDGVYQSKSNYSISGTTLTFTTAPPNGTAVEAITHTQTTINEPAANTVTPAKIAAGDFYFDTNTLYIDATNNRVGVGNSTPYAPLHVTGTIKVATGNAQGILGLGEGNGTSVNVGLWRGAANAPTTDGNYLNLGGYDGIVFAASNAAIGSQTERMRIDSSGRVMINTTTPTNFQGDSSKLGIYDSTRATLSIQAGGYTNPQNAEIFLSGGIGDGGTRTEGWYIRGAGTGAGGNVQTVLDIIQSRADTDILAARFDTSGALRINSTSTQDTKLFVEYSTASSNIGAAIISNPNASASRAMTVNIGANATLIAFDKSFAGVGSITTNGSSVAYNTTSDYRLKENVVEMDGAIDRVKLLQPKRFNFIADETDTTVDGFLAHEVQDIVPEAIHGIKDEMQEEEYEVTPAVLDEDGNVVTEAVMGTREVPVYQGIDQSKLVPLLTKAIQELSTLSDNQQTIIDDLKARIETLENA